MNNINIAEIMEWYKVEKEVGDKLDAKADERDHKHYFRHGI